VGDCKTTEQEDDLAKDSKWKMSEPKQGFTEEDEKILSKMMQNMSLESLKKSKTK